MTFSNKHLLLLLFVQIYIVANVDLSHNPFTSRLGKMCRMSVFEYGEIVELRADCRICNCDRICRTCHDNIDHLYLYDDDDWLFDDDTVWAEGEGTEDDDDDDDDDTFNPFAVTGEINVETEASNPPFPGL